eukprot:gene35449-45935_t
MKDDRANALRHPKLPQKHKTDSADFSTDSVTLPVIVTDPNHIHADPISPPTRRMDRTIQSIPKVVPSYPFFARPDRLTMKFCGMHITSGPSPETTDLSSLSNNAKCFWTKLWAGQVPLGLGQPPSPNTTFPIVPLSAGPCLQRKSNSWSRERVPWGPQPFSLLVEDVSHKEPKLPHMLIHHSYDLANRDGKRPWFPYVLHFKPYDYQTRMSYKELQEARRYVAKHAPPSPRTSTQSHEFRPYAFHSTSFLDPEEGLLSTYRRRTSLRLTGAEIFSSFDAHSGFTQMHPNSRHLTVFITPMGLFQFTRLSMGLRNGPASFSRGMSFMPHDLPGMLALFEKHYQVVRKFLQRCFDINLRLNGKKCFIGESEIKFLEHWNSVNGIRPDA